ncbi:MAG TPA: enoyl-CoA hydratase/isomerase family protein [Candidatus Thermoplasmatota archaeon]|nr:enoyl-CoA hydratase/isomerase family protein [Candidatus Thermoplasmatota archaeon]
MFRVEHRDGVSVLRMDDGKVNVMGPTYVREFGPAWRDATQGDRPVVLVGNARAFSAGLDLKTLPTLEKEELVAFTHGFMGVFRDVLQYPRPVVAVVDGPALAGGAVLALVSDIRLATPAARIGLTEVPVGIPLPPPIADLARAKLPTQELAEALLDGAVREGARCVEHGWAQRLADRDAAPSEAVGIAAALGGHNPLAFSSAKSAITTAPLAAFDRFLRDGGPEAWVSDLAHPDTMAALLRTMERLSRKA